MRKKIIKLLFYIFFVLYSNNTFAEVLKKLEINGNERISNETIKVYGEIELNKDYQNEDVNDIIKRLYNTNFFSNISTKFNNGVLIIYVKENPIICYCTHMCAFGKLSNCFYSFYYCFI